MISPDMLQSFLITYPTDKLTQKEITEIGEEEYQERRTLKLTYLQVRIATVAEIDTFCELLPKLPTTITTLRILGSKINEKLASEVTKYLTNLQNLFLDKPIDVNIMQKYFSQLHNFSILCDDKAVYQL